MTSYVNLFILAFLVYIYIYILYHINNLKYVSDAFNIFIVSSHERIYSHIIIGIRWYNLSVKIQSQHEILNFNINKINEIYICK